MMMSSIISTIKKDYHINIDCVQFLEAIEDSWCFRSPFASNYSSPKQVSEEEEEEEEEEEGGGEGEREKSVEEEKEEEDDILMKEVAWQLFQVLDEDKDGLVALHQLLSFLSRIGLSLTLQNLHTMFNLSKSSPNNSNHNHNHNHNQNHDHYHGFVKGDESGTQLTFHDFHSLCVWGQVGNMGDQLGMGEREEEGFDNEDEDEDEVLSAFRVFDRNGDGFISAQDLRITLACMGLMGRRNSNKNNNSMHDDELGIEECQKMIERVDMDSDGLIDLSEFKHMLLLSSTNSTPSSLTCTVSA